MVSDIAQIITPKIASAPSPPACARGPRVETRWDGPTTSTTASPPAWRAVRFSLDESYGARDSQRQYLRGHTMITKFDSSYYGTAEMENLGYTATPINERRYSKAELAKAMHKVVAYAKCMDERGYDTFWMAEHHFQPEGTELIPNLLMWRCTYAAPPGI